MTRSRMVPTAICWPGRRCADVASFEACDLARLNSVQHRDRCVSGSGALSCGIPAPAAPAAGLGNEAAAGAWGILRNMMQEFPTLDWAGSDCSAATTAEGAVVKLPGADAYGSAQDGEAPQEWQHAHQHQVSVPGACLPNVSLQS